MTRHSTFTDTLRRTLADTPVATSAWHLLLGLLIWQTTTRIPEASLDTSERVNLFAGLLFALYLAVGGIRAWLTQRFGTWSWRATFSLVLTGLALASGLHSDFNPSDTYRASVLILSMLCGYWIARWGHSQAFDLNLLMALFLPALAGVLSIALYGYLGTDHAHQASSLNPHALADVLILLGFVPLLMARSHSKHIRRTGQILLLLIALSLVLGGPRSVLFILPAVSLMVLVRWRKRSKVFVVAATLVILVIGYHQVTEYMGKEGVMTHESTYYRLESYTIAAHIAARNPALGIGLRSPRLPHMEGYKIWYPDVYPLLLEHSLKRIVTSENIFLTMAVGCGLPFTLLYMALLGLLLKDLYAIRRRGDSKTSGLATAFLIPLGCCLAHSLIYDSLLQAEVSFLFHFLLGSYPAIRHAPAHEPWAGA